MWNWFRFIYVPPKMGSWDISRKNSKMSKKENVPIAFIWCELSNSLRVLVPHNSYFYCGSLHFVRHCMVIAYGNTKLTTFQKRLASLFAYLRWSLSRRWRGIVYLSVRLVVFAGCIPRIVHKFPVSDRTNIAKIATGFILGGFLASIELETECNSSSDHKITRAEQKHRVNLFASIPNLQYQFKW